LTMKRTYPSGTTLIDEKDNEEEEDMEETTSSGTMASTSTQIASPPHLSTGDISTAQGTTSTFIIDDDPAQWPKVLTDSERCQIVRKGTVQITDIQFPQNSENPPRRFTKENYRRTMKNGEKILRSWLVYSMSTDSVFCFPCTVFGKRDNALSKLWFHKWKNLTYHLKEHEYSKGHCDNMRNWHELQRRLQNKTTIDQRQQALMQIEIEHWKAVIRRVIAIICHLAERNQALRGTTSELYDPHNGNFLAQVELMAKFDPVMNEHIRRIQNQEAKVHYLSGTIQNEIIALIGNKVLEEIVRRAQRAKYYSVIMDCTPDISHKEQLSVVLRLVNCDPSVSIAEHFFGFIDVEDTSGKGLTEVLLDHLQKHNLSISDCRGQSYDNGSNMMGQKQGVQARILQLNNKALCIPCSSHTLNLVVADAAKSSVLSTSFFGVLQRLYNLFSSSVQRWAVLRKHVKQLTLKPLSATRWEARIDSVEGGANQFTRDPGSIVCSPDIWYGEGGLRDHVSAKKQRKKKRQFQYEGTEETQSTPDETFRRDFFLPFSDTALRSLGDRFQVEGVYDLYDFLFSKDNMKQTIKNGKRRSTLLPCVYILTLPVSVASGERSFSALKLIKTYMRSTMGQERLTGLDIVVAFAEAKVRKQKF
uniref:TTF-type domain-containing protein n=1 Tax=Astyanax mexicanus TaxID=7994 RepID=A0A3B1J9M7_ASTMX